MSYREGVLQTLEEAAAKMWSSGTCERWLAEAEPGVAAVSRTVNGPLMLDLCKLIEYEDIDCVELFRTGGLR